WFPAVRTFGPPKSLEASYLDWGQVELIPDARPPGAGPVQPAPHVRPVGPEDTWRFARETDAAFVKIGPGNIAPGNPRVWPEGEVEKFLFYRGLGSFGLPLEVRHGVRRDGTAVLTLHNRGGDALRGVFAVRVEKGAIQFAPLSDLPGHGTLTASA